MWDNYNVELLEDFSNNIKNNSIVDVNAIVNKTNNNGSTILHIASFIGHTKLIKQLLELGSDINALNNNNSTACMLASNKEALEVIFNHPNFDKKKNLHYIIEKEVCNFYQNQETLLLFLKNFKNDIKKLEKRKKIKLLQNVYKISESEQHIKEALISFIKKEKIDNKSLEIDGFMTPIYLIKSDTGQIQFKKWSEEIHYNSLESFNNIQQLIKDNSIASIEIDKSYSLGDIYYFLKEGLNNLKSIFSIDNLGNNELNIKITHNQSQLGQYHSVEKQILLSLTSEQLKQGTYQEFSVLAHEYTHYLQFRFLPYYEIDSLYLNYFSKQWQEIINTVNKIKVPEKKCIDFLYTTTLMYMNLYGCSINKESKMIIKSYLQDYLINNKSDETNIEKYMRKNIKDDVVQYYEKTIVQLIDIIKSVKHALHNQEKGFYQSLWKKIDNLKETEYYNTPIEIHARLVQGIYFGNNVLDGLIPYAQKRILKPKLEKFNNLIKSHQILFSNVKNDKIKII